MAYLSSQIEVKFEVDSRYSIVETIGNGAYGVVCSAVDKKTGCKVAIKKISRAFDVPAITKRTLRELKILKHFKHDNVIGIKEILRPPEDLSQFNDVYVVFDLMESDLHHIIHSKQSLSNEHVEYFLYQILRGLKYIHSANIIHRDLKPSNILVNHDCELKIGDFGMARSLLSSPNEQRRVMTEYVATRWYRAPELMLSVHQFSCGIDIWSVGCILAEMLGRAPIFPGANYLNQLQLILSVVGLPSAKFLSEVASERVRNYISRLPQKEPVSLNKLFPDAPKNAIDLLSVMLKLDPRERCTAQEALEHPYVSRYHDMDDEPSCRPLTCEFENLPLENDILKDEIVQEIRSYHSKHLPPKLTPLATKYFAKPVNLNEGTRIPCTLPSIEESLVNVSVISSITTMAKRVESRKRKSKGSRRDSKVKKVKGDVDKKSEEDNGLSAEDKKMLERWKNMQKTTTPFIHPIRKHMKELIDIQNEEVGGSQCDNIDGQNSTGFDAKNKAQFHFTNLVPAQKGGVITLVKDNADKTATVSKFQKVSVTPVSTVDKPLVTCSKMPIPQYASKPLPTTEAKTATGQMQPPDSTILVPMGAIPCYQIRGPFNPKGQVILLPNVKPAPIANQNPAGMVIAPNLNLTVPVTIPATSLLTVPQTGIKTVVPIAAKPAVPSTSVKCTNATTKSLEMAAANTVLVNAANTSFENYQGSSQPTTVKSVLNSGLSENKLVSSKAMSPQGGTDATRSTNEAPSSVCVVTPDGKLKAVSPKDLLSTNGSPLNEVISNRSTFGNENWSLAVSNSQNTKEEVKNDLMKKEKKEEETSRDEDDSERLNAELRKLDPHERNIVELVRQLEAESENRNVEINSGDEKEKLHRPKNLPVTTAAATSIQSTLDVTSSTYRSPDLEIPSISFSSIADDCGGGGEEDCRFELKAARDVLLTTLLTPKTPKSGAYGYGIGLDLEELFNQTNPQEFWSSTREAPSDDRSTALECAPLSSSLLNDWLGIKNLDTEAMEELRKELETNTSLLLFDT